MAIKLEFFTLVQNFLALAPTNNQTASIQIPSDANFIWSHGFCQSDVAAAGQTDATRVVPLVTVFLQSASGRNLGNNAVAQNGIPLPAVFGGDKPLELPKPLLFAANSVVNINVYNYDAAQTYNLRLCLIGYKQYNV